MAEDNDKSFESLLTIAECQEIIKRKTKTDIEVEITRRDIKISKLGGEVAGFLGEHLKLAIAVGGKIYRFFLKTLPLSKKDKEIRKFLIKSKIFEKETEVYKFFESFTDLSVKWRPECYFLRKDVIVLEDLSELGYSIMPDHFEFTQTHVKMVLKSIAALHASSLLYEERENTRIIEKYKHCLFEVSAQRNNSWFVTGLKCLVDIALDIFKDHPEIKKKIKEELLKALLKACDEIEFLNVTNGDILFPNVVCHRDLWTKNLFFDSETNPQNCILIDFQIARFLPPGTDIMMACTMLQRKRQREQNFDSNLQFYYDSLKDFLYGSETGRSLSVFLPIDQVEKGCSNFLKMSLILKGIFLTMTHLPTGVMTEIHANKVEYDRFITKDRSPTVMKYFREDACFRSWMYETVEELVEVALKLKVPTKKSWFCN